MQRKLRLDSHVHQLVDIQPPVIGSNESDGFIKSLDNAGLIVTVEGLVSPSLVL
jgi:hypothetical protein